MTGAQLENGYTRIANEIMDQISRTKLNGTQFRIVMTVLRYTYGFNRKEHAMSVSFLANATGLNKRQVQRELGVLVNASIILVVKEATFSSPAVIGFNKHFDQWCLNSHQASSQTLGDELDVQTGDELDTGGGDELDTQERQLKDNIKDNIYCREILDCWNQKNIIVHRPSKVITKAIYKALKENTKENIMKAITRYAIMLKDDKCEWCSYTWTLDIFLSRNRGYKSFLDDGEKWINYQKTKQGANQARNRASPETETKQFYVPPEVLSDLMNSG